MEKCLQTVDFLATTPFVQLPKSVLAMDMSCEAKLLYGSMADLMKLSQKNGFRDERGLYAFCSLKYVEDQLRIGEKKAIRAVRELVDHRLILKRRMGQGRPNRYYLLPLEAVEFSDRLTEEEYMRAVGYPDQSGEKTAKAVESADQSGEKTAKAVESADPSLKNYLQKGSSDIQNSHIDGSRTFSYADIEELFRRF